MAAVGVKANGVEANSPTIAGVNQNYAICNNWAIKDGRNITETDVLTRRTSPSSGRTSWSRS